MKISSDSPMASPSKVDLNSPDAAAAALRVLSKVAERWGLTYAERQTILGVSGASLLGSWLTAGEINAGLDPETVERLSYIFRIYEALHVLIPIQERADA